MIKTFDILLLVGGLCGLAMVLGGLLLLYKGAITLSQASPSDAVTLEFRRQFKLSTQYPALGLFVIGLGFVVTALSFARPDEPIEVMGTTEPMDGVEVTVMQKWKLVAADGQVFGQVVPELDALWVEVVAPGHQPRSLRIPVQGRRADLGRVELETLAELPTETDVFELPEGFTAPPLTTATFGSTGS